MLLNPKFELQNHNSRLENQNTIMVSPPLSQARLTIPNLITLTRIILTPLFIIFLIQGRYRQALIVFCLAGLSDLADGLIARWWQQKSRLGSYLDPLADKLLMSTSFVTLSIFRVIPSWLTVMVISRDIILGLGVLILLLADYPLVIKPSLAGKSTTTVQLLTVGLVLLARAKFWHLPPGILTAFFYITAGLTAFSGIHYIYGGLKLVSQQAEDRQDDDG
jgi:cardiolipin synthase (CMP-forming)